MGISESAGPRVIARAPRKPRRRETPARLVLRTGGSASGGTPFRVCGVFVMGVAAALGVTAGSAFAQQTHILVVTGAPGDPEHAEKFDKWAKTFIDAARTKDAVSDSNITYLADRSEEHTSELQ